MRVAWIGTLAFACAASCAGGTGVPSGGGAAAGGAIVAERVLAARIVVIGPSGCPVPGATVSLVGDGFDAVAETATGEDGVATLTVLGERGPIRLHVSPPSGAVALLAKSMKWKPCAETTVRLDKSFTVAGTIVDPDGHPVPRVRYWLSRGDGSFGPYPSEADDRGGFVVRDVAEGGVLIAAGDFPWHQMSSPGWPSLDHPEAVAKLATRISAGTQDARVPLAAEYVLRIDLEGPAGVQASASTTTLFGPGNNAPWREETHDPVVTNAGRTLLFTGLTPGRSFTLFTRAESRGLVVWEEDLRAGARRTVAWREGKDLLGKVVLPDRKELHNVEVRVEICRIWISTKAERDGSFRIGPLPPVPLSVRVFASVADGDWCGDFEATPGSEPCELRPGEKPISASPR